MLGGCLPGCSTVRPPTGLTRHGGPAPTGPPGGHADPPDVGRRSLRRTARPRRSAEEKNSDGEKGANPSTPWKDFRSRPHGQQHHGRTPSGRQPERERERRAASRSRRHSRTPIPPSARSPGPRRHADPAQSRTRHRGARVPRAHPHPHTHRSLACPHQRTAGVQPNGVSGPLPVQPVTVGGPRCTATRSTSERQSEWITSQPQADPEPSRQRGGTDARPRVALGGTHDSHPPGSRETSGDSESKAGPSTGPALATCG